MTYIINQVIFFDILMAKNTQLSAKVTNLHTNSKYNHIQLNISNIIERWSIIFRIRELCGYKYRIFALRKVRPYFQFPAFYQKIPIKSQIF